VLSSVSGYSGGYDEEMGGAPEETFAEVPEHDAFATEEPTGVRARRSTAVGAPPAPMMARPSMLASQDVKVLAKAAAPETAKKKASGPRSVQAPTGYPTLERMGQQPEPHVARKVPAGAPRRTFAIAAVLALLALIALLLWWLLA
jgi:hypothetical protein